MEYIRRTSTDIKQDFLINLLKDRKIIGDSEQFNEMFFYPTKANEEDPLLLDHIEEGCKLLKEAIENNKTIYLPQDPDCDGITSAALFYNYCKEVLEEKFNKEIKIEYHIPEGKEHGLSTIMDWFPEKGNDNLIFVIDASSNDYEEHKTLKERGYNICVVDHHEAPRYSENAIVINNQLSEDYPNKALSGVGVIYKFFECWEAMYGGNSIQNYTDLAALGMISDVMVMSTLENRYFCDYGLTHIHNKFFLELIKKQAYSLFGISTDSWSDIYLKELTQIGVAFYITPLINALIRVGNSLEKERLFEAFIKPDVKVPSTKRGEKGLMETIATQSARNCTNAKSKQTRERDKAAELLDIQILENNLEENKILILNADELNVNNTLTGLCAMNVAAKYKKPVMLGRITPDGKEMKGSIRNFDGSPLKDFKAFLQNSGLTSYVEGHAGAAGWGAPVKNLNKLIDYANEKLKDLNFNEGSYETDFIVRGNCSYLKDLINDLDSGKKYWGQGSPEPIVVVEDINLNKKDFSVIGKNLDTLKFIYNGITYIKFKANDIIEKLEDFDDKINITVIGTPNVNEWGGRRTMQIQINDIEFKESSALDF